MTMCDSYVTVGCSKSVVDFNMIKCENYVAEGAKGSILSEMVACCANPKLTIVGEVLDRMNCEN